MSPGRGVQLVEFRGAGQAHLEHLGPHGADQIRADGPPGLPGGYICTLASTSVVAARAAGRLEAGEILTEHIRHTVDLLLDRSRVLADRVAAGQAAVVGLYYRLADGSAQLVAARGLDIPVSPAP